MQISTRRELIENERQNLNEFSDLIAKIAFHRGIFDNKALRDFISPNYETGTNDSGLLKNIDIAVKKIHDTILADQKICIYSDYDADGVPGAVVLADYFHKINYQNFFNYIPHRNKEGFGLNKKAIEKIAEQGAKLIITIDCGITDFEPVDRANELGVDVIITDHHEVHDKMPNAFAIINPKQPDCIYPDKNLCGAGVVFKLVQALIAYDKKEIPTGWEKWLLDMVGIATISDMVPLIGENRVLAKYGMLVLKKTPRHGLQKLFKQCRLSEKNLTEDDIGFSIAPRINAASRMDHPETAFQMLFSKDPTEAGEAVTYLDKINNERKGKVASMVKEIKHFLTENADNPEIADSPIIVRGHVNWSPSLLGLAASSIVETYNKPVFLWGKGEGDNFKGSCRSNGSVNLVKMMTGVEGKIIYDFGGHEMAGGFSVFDDAIYDLHKELEKSFQIAKKGDGEIVREILVDHELTLSQINWNLYNELEKLAPFGVGNPKPIFMMKGVPINEIQKFGKEGNHLKIIFEQNLPGQKWSKKISAIKFFNDDEKIFERLKKGDKINLVFNLEKSVFGNYPELRMRILNIH